MSISLPSNFGDVDGYRPLPLRHRISQASNLGDVTVAPKSREEGVTTGALRSPPDAKMAVAAAGLCNFGGADGGSCAQASACA